MDVNLGCSGYGQGLALKTTHVQTRAGRRELLLVDKTISEAISKYQFWVAYLFGNA
jgi:hypothetical protein